jgi:hypothetical protein
MVDVKGLKTVSAAESIAGVMALVSGVAKSGRNEAQRFNFRGIDAVVNAVGPALREVGGLVVPRLMEKSYERGQTKSGASTIEVFLTVQFAWFGTDGGDPICGTVASEAMDMSDKSTAKAMSVAFRTFLLQTLMLPTDEKDPDAEFIERGNASAPVVPVVPAVATVVDPKRADELRVELAACDTPTTLNALWASMGPVYQPLLKEDFSARKAALK